MSRTVAQSRSGAKPSGSRARSGAGATRAVPMALVVAGLLLVAANLRAGITTVGPVLTEVQDDLGLPSSTASILISLPLLAFAVISPIAPRLTRRLGLERALTLALLVLAVGLVARSLPGLVLLWLGTALLGVAIAVLNVALPALVKRDFPNRIGQMTGAYSVVQSTMAAAAAGIAVPVANATALGWRLPLGMWAGLALIAVGVMVPQLRRHTVVTPAEDDVHLSVDHTPWRSPWRCALGWQVTAFMGLQSVGYYILVTWLPAIERSAGVGESAAGVHQLLLNGFGIVGSITCSALMNRLPDQRPLAVGGPVLFIVAAVGLLWQPGYGALWAAVAGVGGGTCIVLALSFFGLRTRNHGQAADLSGMAQSVGYLLAAAGPIVIGALHDRSGSWTPGLIVLIGLEVCLMVFGWFAGRNRVIG
jgi:MFS transporter, CP family, cyanate transporter